MARNFSWISVLSAFQSLDYRAEHAFPRGFVLFQGVGIPGEGGDLTRQARSSLCREDAPAEEAVRSL